MFNSYRAQLEEMRDQLAEAEAEVADLRAAGRARRKRRRAGEVDEEDEVDLVAGLGKFCVLFITPYTGNHLFGVIAAVVGFARNDIDTRFDEKFPNNIKSGEALDLLHYADESIRALIIGVDHETVIKVCTQCVLCSHVLTSEMLP